MSFLIPRAPARRQLLRAMFGGGAVTLALPFLDCYLNTNGSALAATGAPLPTRFGTWYWGMGHTPDHAIAEKRETSAGIGFLEETESLKPFGSKLSYFGNFMTPLDGKSNFAHFTGWVANRVGTPPGSGSDIPGTTLDLMIADVIGNASRFKTIDATAIGIASENYSARGTNSHGAAETSPISLYARIFGPEFVDPNKADFKPDPKIMLKKSVLSAFTEESQAFTKSLGASDKARLDEYFTAIRQVETQLALQLQKPPPNESCLVPPKVDEHVDNSNAGREMGQVIETHKIMSKLMAMAVACNQTRVFNMVFTDANGNVRRKGEAHTHHILTHEEAIDTKLGYQPLAFWFNKACMDGFATFLQTLDSIKEGDGTLLDNSLIFATSETNYARVHTVDGIPTYLAGRAGGKVKSGLHVIGNGDPITRIGFTVMRLLGVPLEKWGTNSLQTSKMITEILA